MMRILISDHNGQLSMLSDLSQPDIMKQAHGYWIDLSEPDEEEKKQFKALFPFLSIPAKGNQKHTVRPQLKFYKDYFQLSIHVMSPNTLKTHELFIGVGEHFLITFHHENLKAINDVWHECRSDDSHVAEHKMAHEMLCRLLNRMIAQYAMAANVLEDRIDDLGLLEQKEPVHKLNRRIFQMRSELLGFRRIITPLIDIIQRLISTPYVKISEEHELVLNNMNDTLNRLKHMIEANLEITSDIRDSYLSLTTYRTNRIMQTLTVITTIFMPLTFIVGVYGMNFHYMPELTWRYGYFAVLGAMLLIALIMYYWFKHKGWFGK